MTDNPPSKSERTRQAIIEAAYVLFIEQGFHGTSMRQIAERAGLALGSIYNHFASKEDIFDNLVLEKHPYQQILPVLLDTPGDTIEVFVHNAAKAMIDALGQHPEFIKILFIEIVEFNGVHAPVLIKTVFPQVAPFLQRFSSIDGRLRDIPAPLIFRTFVGLFFSYFITELMIGNADLPDFKVNSLDHFVDIFLYGILKDKEAA